MKPLSTKRSHRRGSTVAAVLLCMVLVGAAVASLTIVFASENRRTQATISGTQARQFLLAAPPYVLQDLQASGNAKRELPIPVPTSDFKVAAAIAPEGDNLARVHVTATRGKALASQTLTYARSGGQWQLQSATLDRDLFRQSPPPAPSY